MERELYICFAHIMFLGENLEYVEAKMLNFFFFSILFFAKKIIPQILITIKVNVM
jgi:hypothetical protein